MTKTAAVYTDRVDSTDAGRHLGEQVSEELGGESPDAVIVFASSRFAYEELLEAISAACNPTLLVGASSAGEFTTQKHGEGTACALAIRSSDLKTCAAEIPTGARVCIMKTTAESAITAASNATASAIRALGGAKPGAALFFDCVATRLRMGEAFGFELASVAKMLGGADLVGCNTYGQIARSDGQFEGFHNCTAVVMVLPS